MPTFKPISLHDKLIYMTSVSHFVLYVFVIMVFSLLRLLMDALCVLFFLIFLLLCWLSPTLKVSVCSSLQ